MCTNNGINIANAFVGVSPKSAATGGLNFMNVSSRNIFNSV